MAVMVMVQANPRADAGESLQQYQPVARDTITRHGGEVTFRGGGAGALSGGRDFKVGLLIRFPDKESAQAWYNDPDYQKVLPLRDKAFSEIEIRMFQEA